MGRFCSPKNIMQFFYIEPDQMQETLNDPNTRVYQTMNIPSIGQLLIMNAHERDIFMLQSKDKKSIVTIEQCKYDDESGGSAHDHARLSSEIHAGKPHLNH
jgi:hypothetical protein